MADWLGINGSNFDSYCGSTSGHGIVEALDGTDYWAHFYDETHWFVVDLGQSYRVLKVKGRSNGGYDPTEINIYVSDDKGDWGAAVKSGISTWVDTVTFVEIETTPKDGRYLKVEITDTENVDNHLTFGASVTFNIFDVYGGISGAGPTVLDYERKTRGVARGVCRGAA